MSKAVVIKGVTITNPTRVWHELKNSRGHFGSDGRAWISGSWYRDGGDGGGMCLANMLRFVTHGRKGAPGEFANQSMDEAEQLVTVLANEKIIQVTGEGARFVTRVDRASVEPGIIANAKKGTVEIPTFNDARVQSKQGFQPIAEVLEEAADLVKPYAFTHSVTIAADIMTDAEKAEIADAVFEDGFGTTMEEWMAPKNTKARAKMEGDFKAWLDSFEDRGWDTFWKELADCDTPECEEARKALAGVK